jgi:hypothetical protein
MASFPASRAHTVRQLSGWSKERGQAAATDDTTAVRTSITHSRTAQGLVAPVRFDIK